MKRVALIHDWLTGMRGGEKVFEILCQLFPDADVYTLVHHQGRVSPLIERHRIFTSPLQKIPGIFRFYRHLLPLMPWAIEQFDFSGYDALISTSHCVAKGAQPASGAPHWCYCHTPMRYVWDQYDHYFAADRAGLAVRTAMQWVRPYLQRWDVDSLPRVQEFIANSRNVQERIQRLYHRSSRVIYPPVDVDFYSGLNGKGSSRRGDYYLVVSALAPYKRIDLAIAACAQLKRRLVIIGEGQESASLRRLAGDGVTFLGWSSGESMRDYFYNARALLFPGEEDFGIVPVEAMAAGCPIIAYGKGGALETVVENQTGLFFHEPQAESLIDAMVRFEKMSWNPQECLRRSLPFAKDRCREAFAELFEREGLHPSR